MVRLSVGAGRISRGIAVGPAIGVGISVGLGLGPGVGVPRRVGVRYVHFVAVLRHERLAVEGLAGLPFEGGDAAGVPRGDVHESEPRRVGPGGEFGGLGRRRVGGAAGAVGVVGRESRVVYQQVRPRGEVDSPVGRSGVAGVDDGPAGARVTDHLLGVDDRPVVEFDGLARVESLEHRADGHAQRLGSLAVETPLPIGLDQDVPHGSGVVVRLERDDLVAVAIADGVAVGGSLDPNRKRLAPGGGIEQPPYPSAGAVGCVDRQSGLAVVEFHRLEETGQPERVVAVKMGEKDVGDAEAGPEAHHLALGPLAAVEQKALALPPEERRTRVPSGRRHRAARPEKRHPKRHTPTERRDK